MITDRVVDRPQAVGVPSRNRVHEQVRVADLLGDTPDWVELSLCGQVDPELFFPEKGESNREAKKICARCPVPEQCLRYALEHDIGFGVWGGLSQGERRKITTVAG